MHLNAFQTVEQTEDRVFGTDDGVVDKTVAAVGFAGAVATHPDHRKVAHGFSEHVADHVGIFPDQGVVAAVAIDDVVADAAEETIVVFVAAVAVVEKLRFSLSSFISERRRDDVSL